MTAIRFPLVRFKWLIFAVLLARVGAGYADTSGFLRWTDDSEDFSERFATVGWRGSAGAGLSAGKADYRAPGWARSGSVLLGTYESTRASSQIDASLGAAELAGYTHAIGHLDYMRRVLPSTRLGLSLERQYVASRLGIDAGITFDQAAAVLEHSFSSQLELGASLGRTQFSNDNTRSQLRTRWSYELAPEAGRYAYLKTRHYGNSNPSRSEYFSPKKLGEWSAGLLFKSRPSPGVVLAAETDYGHQETDATSRPLWSLGVSLSSPRQQKVQWRVALEWSNSVSSATAGNHYRYSSLTAKVGLPF